MGKGGNASRPISTWSKVFRRAISDAQRYCFSALPPNIFSFCNPKHAFLHYKTYVLPFFARCHLPSLLCNAHFLTQHPFYIHFSSLSHMFFTIFLFHHPFCSHICGQICLSFISPASNAGASIYIPPFRDSAISSSTSDYGTRASSSAKKRPTTNFRFP